MNRVTQALAALYAVAALLLSLATQGQTLERAALAELSLDFAEIKAVTTRPGREQLMRLDTLPGDRLQLYLPFTPNRTEWLVGDGSQVTEGQAIGQVSGPELEHWLFNAEQLKERVEGARLRYEQNRPLYEQQSLSANTWQSILEYYHSLRLELQHTQHVLEWLKPGVDSESGATLRAPRGGLLLVTENMDEKDPIVEIVPQGALRVRARIAARDEGEIIALQVGGCQLPVARVDNRVQGFSRNLWSMPVASCALARPGLSLSGVPLYQFDGYAVSRDAVLNHHGTPHIAVQTSAGLEVVQVAIVGESASAFYVTSERELLGAKVLIRSTSAVQGLLLGLGKD